MNSFLERKTELKFSKTFTEKDFQQDYESFKRLALFLYDNETKELENYYFYLKKSNKPEQEQVELIKAWMISRLDKEHLKLGLKKAPRKFFTVKKWLGL